MFQVKYCVINSISAHCSGDNNELEAFYMDETFNKYIEGINCKTYKYFCPYYSKSLGLPLCYWITWFGLLINIF